jgi:DNA (cytosine-5)-methyltransferase 1
VFVVASARDGFNPAEVLFEFESLRRDTAPSREARKEVTECAGTLTANGGGLNRPAGNANELDFCVTVDTAKCLTAGSGQRYDFETDTFLAMRVEPIAPALTASNDPSRSPQSSEVTQQVAAVHAASMAVRRLTPVECERLQGFPDGYTNIPWRNKPESPDGPRYKALGNSWAVPVVAWIGKRIQEAIA